jgi:CheY-like chemotaxis protein
MSLRDRVAPHLPFLRRYARALAGSQRLGDATIRAMLAALASGEASLNEGLPTRVAVYRLFHSIGLSPFGGGAAERDRPEVASPEGPFGGGAAERDRPEVASPEGRLRRLTPPSRQALLLYALEGFSFRDIGAILDTSPSEAERLARHAQTEIEQQLATSVLVIEDEAMIALDIKELAEELGHQVVGIARTKDEAVRLAHQHAPGLVLADIRLADESSGVDAVRQILLEFSVPVVFVTAYPERLLTGEKDDLEPTYLLTKPFDRAALQATIGQALFFHRSDEARSA